MFLGRSGPPNKIPVWGMRAPALGPVGAVGAPGDTVMAPVGSEDKLNLLEDHRVVEAGEAPGRPHWVGITTAGGRPATLHT